MKKLGKLNINLKNVIKNEELITLKGGEPSTCCCGDSENECCYGYLVSASGDCWADCRYAFGNYAGGTPGNCASNCDICTSGY